MNKSVVFGIGGVAVGTGIGFVIGKITYKKKLDKAERDIEILLKEINRPEKDSEVGDGEDTSEEESSEGAIEAGSEVKEDGRQLYFRNDLVPDEKEIEYETFYREGYKMACKIGVDPAEAEHPVEESDDSEDVDSASEGIRRINR